MLVEEGEAGLVDLSGGEACCCCKEVTVEEGCKDPLGLDWCIGPPGKRGSCRGCRWGRPAPWKRCGGGREGGQEPGGL